MALLLFTLLGPLMARGNVLITEIMPDNARILADEDGDFSDWLELQNLSSEAVNLEGWSLTDDPGSLRKWTFPALVLPAGGIVVVFASGKDRTNDTSHLHTNFELNDNGEFLALVEPDGFTLASAFSPAYPPVKEDVAYGSAQTVQVRSLLSQAVPSLLIPQQAGDLPADWAQTEFVPGVAWFSAFAPAALGFDTQDPVPAPSNLAIAGTAQQSTSLEGQEASLAINGSLVDYAQTLNTDNAPFWQVTLAADTAVHQIILWNRSGCCGSRLRDITVEVLTEEGAVTNFVSDLLNPENTGYTYPDGPVLLTVDLVALTGQPVPGRMVRVRRTPDPDLSGTGGQGDVNEPSVLALAEVQVQGVPFGAGHGEVNLARTGSPAPTATQSSTLGSFAPNLAINGDLADFTHTLGTDNNASWTLDLGRESIMNRVVLHNRDSCCGSRLRDITVEILDAGSQVVYTSALLNPENAGYSFPNGPDSLEVDLTASPVLGQRVRVRRTTDPDLSGTGGQGNADEASVLSLGEVLVLGFDLSGYRPFIRTDLATAMLGVNASAFVRLPFGVDAPAEISGLNFPVRFDDGFVAYLNGVEVTRRNAPPTLGWNSTATASRTLSEGITPELVNLTPFLGLLHPGQNVLALQALNVSASDQDFLMQPDLLESRVAFTEGVFLSSATPGALNDSDFYFDEVADTRFSVDRGFFTEPFSVEIVSDTPDAVIYYSLDSSEPDPVNGIRYEGPIGITATTVLRARAYREGWKPTDVDTHTYLFVEDIIHQAEDWPVTRVPPSHFPASWGNNAVDYGMDPTIVSQHDLEAWREALTQIPSMSIVTEMENLFDPVTGIYANALQHGIDWERPASLELIDPGQAESSRFQENCGLRIRGGFSRNPQFVKHSFRVFFRREYGAGKLRYPLFEDAGATEFDTFDLRTSQNYSWPRESSFNNGSHDTMVREVWCRETLGVMGQPYRRSRYYHLYVNGQYWGLYETDERPEASYGETYLGGDKEDYDVVKCANHVGNFVTEVTDGDFGSFSNLWSLARAVAANPSDANYFRVLGRNPDGTRNPNLPVLLEVDNLIDYMLGIFYSGDGDATLSGFLGNTRPNNWFGMNNRNDPNTGFRFFNSDCEHTLGAPSSQVDRTGPFGGLAGSNIGNFTYANPQYIHEDLMWNAEYRLRFADRVQKHFFNGGALTFQQCTNRWFRKANQIDKAIRAYSARWGDAVREPPYNETNWRDRIADVAENWFPGRAGIVLQQLRTDGLFFSIGAPSFSSYGGIVAPDFVLTMEQTNVSGTIYYTLDGTDPRLVGGGVSPNALVYTGPVAPGGNAFVRARVLTPAGWSPQVDASFTSARFFENLAVTEIMYHPVGTETTDKDEFEFLELKNTGPMPLDLSGLFFSEGITFTFANGTRLASGQFLVLVRNETAFASRYPGVPVHGVYGGGLANGGETLRLSHAIAGPVFAVTYGDALPWPLTPDGLGFSLVPKESPATLNSDNPLHWRASAQWGGSPGREDPDPGLPLVVVNEALTHTVSGEDFIELHNPSGVTADISGWFLSDDKDVPTKYRIPSATEIPGGGHVVFTEADFNALPGQGTSFSLNGQGDQVYVYSGDESGQLSGYSHGFEFGAAPDGVSFGRHVISTGEEHFPLQQMLTPGFANAGPAIGPVVLAEIHYHPNALSDEFVELQNISGAPVELFEAGFPENSWRLNGAGFQFPPGTMIPASARAILTSVEPSLFRLRHGLEAEVAVFGPWSGTLQNSGERLELQRPESTTNGLVYITVDEVRYNDKSPWPVEADGSGPSLQRSVTWAYGNEPTNWIAAAPSPGEAVQPGLPPFITRSPGDETIVAFQNVTFNVEAAGDDPLFYQWRFEGFPLPGATGTTLLLTNIQFAQDGSYDVIVYNRAGTALSDPAHLHVLVPASILAHPQSQSIKLGHPVTFSVMATSTSPLRYQWRFNGVAIPNATNNMFFLPAVTSLDGGSYDVVVTDAAGPVLSRSATLLVLIPPVVQQPQSPLDIIVTAGATVTFAVEVNQDATMPIYYRWRRGFGNLAPPEVAPNGVIELNSHRCFLTITNLQTATFPGGNIITLSISNAAHFPTLLDLHTNAFLTVNLDSDGDGMADVYEDQYASLDKNNANDGQEDADGDGSLNREEHEAGTDPEDPDSYLKITRIAAAGVVMLDFKAVAARTYTVLFSDALHGGMPSVLCLTEPCPDWNGDPGVTVWRPLTQVIAAPGDRLLTVRDEDAGALRLYRLMTPAR